MLKKFTSMGTVLTEDGSRQKKEMCVGRGFIASLASVVQNRFIEQLICNLTPWKHYAYSEKQNMALAP